MTRDLRQYAKHTRSSHLREAHLSTAFVVLFVCCCATAEPTPPSSQSADEPIEKPAEPEPTYREPRVIDIVPGHDEIVFILAAGERAGVVVGDRGYMRCFDAELRVTKVFEFRSQAVMRRPEPWPGIGPVRIYLHGADPIPWCPEPPH